MIARIVTEKHAIEHSVQGKIVLEVNGEMQDFLLMVRNEKGHGMELFLPRAKAVQLAKMILATDKNLPF